MRIRLTRNKPDHLLESAVTNPAFTPKSRRVSIFARYYIVAENCQVNLQRSLLKWPARYNFFEVRSKTFVVPKDQSHFIRENVFNADAWYWPCVPTISLLDGGQTLRLLSTKTIGGKCEFCRGCTSGGIQHKFQFSTLLQDCSKRTI